MIGKFEYWLLAAYREKVGQQVKSQQKKLTICFKIHLPNTFLLLFNELTS